MHRGNDVAPNRPEPGPASVRPAAADERSLRERQDELLIEIDSMDSRLHDGQSRSGPRRWSVSPELHTQRRLPRQAR